MTSFGGFLIIAYGVLIGLMLSPALASSEALVSMGLDFLPQFVATIAGVFAGAWITVHWEEKKATREEQRRRAAAANMALFTLGRMYTTYLQLLRDTVEPVRLHPARWYAMNPLAAGFENPHFEFDSLQFLLSSRDPNVLGQLDMWQSRFHTLMALVERRSVMHAEILQPKTEAAGLTDTADVRELSRIAGVRIERTLGNYTDGIVVFVDDGISSIPSLAQELKDAAAPMIGREKLISFDFSEKTELSNSTPAPHE